MPAIVYDGRTARKQRGIDSMLQAGLMLAQRGNWRPSAKDIAEFSGVSARTFFANFGTVEDFYEALLARHEASLRALVNAEGPNALIRIVITGRSNYE